jgi:hypothetical protein
VVNRGVVKKISFEIEYPDGSVKTSVLEKELDDLAAIVLSEEAELGNLKIKWDKSDEWKENATMYLVPLQTKGHPFPYCRWKYHLSQWPKE